MKRGIILVTGSRHETSAVRVGLGLMRAQKILQGMLPNTREMARFTVFHGAARGADNVADQEAQISGLEVKRFPADWDRHGKGAGPIRNQLMVDCALAETGSLGDAGAAVCVAFPKDGSIGTWDCIKRAHKAGLTVLIQPELS